MFMGNRSGRRVRAFSTNDLLAIVFILLFLLLIIVFMLPRMRSRKVPNRAICASNLRGIGQGLHIYANDNRGWFPHHYYEALPREESPIEHGVTWVGTMGSNDFLSITEATSPERSPRRNHPSRSLFMLVIGGQTTAGQFVCPSSGDIADDMRNYGPDATDGSGSSAARPGKTRFDFRGYNNLSYSYQIPYGHWGRPRETMDARVAIMADKGPYYAAGGAGVAGTRTVRDKLSGLTPPAEWADMEPAALINRPRQDWRRYNSANHNREGQNVL